MKHSNTPMAIEFTGLIMFTVMLKQLAWWNDGMALWSLSYGTS